MERNGYPSLKKKTCQVMFIEAGLPIIDLPSTTWTDETIAEILIIVTIPQLNLCFTLCFNLCASINYTFTIILKDKLDFPSDRRSLDEPLWISWSNDCIFPLPANITPISRCSPRWSNYSVWNALLGSISERTFHIWQLQLISKLFCG